MDTMSDAVDPVQPVDAFPNPDKVNKSQRSNPDRRRKFDQELQKQLEEEKKRKRRSDELVLERKDSDSEEAADDSADDEEDTRHSSEEQRDDKGVSDSGVDITA
jgi:hypothetical protein